MQGASRLVQRVEEDFDLLRHRIGGWSSWAVFRPVVVRRVMQMPLDHQRPPDPSARWRRLRGAAMDLPAVARLKPSRVLAKTSAVARRDIRDGRTADVFFDDLLTRIGGGIKVEDAQPARSRPPALVPPAITTTLMAMVAERIARVSTPPGAREQAAIFARVLREHIGVEIGERRLEAALCEFWWMRAAYGWLLDRVTPEVVLTTNPEVALLAAAKERGIRTAELQHGLLTRDYISYSWTPYALTHKASIPSPDRFLTHGSYWSDELRATGFWGPELRTTGSISLDAPRQRRPDRDGVFRILVTTQGTDTVRLIAFLRAFVQRMGSRTRYELAIAMHPLYDHSNAEWSAAFGQSPNVRIHNGDRSVYDLLSHADVHLSICSTCHYEAIAFGVPTVVLPLFDHEVVMHLVAEGAATLAGDPDALADAFVAAPPPMLPPTTRERYYCAGALDSTVREIEALLAEPRERSGLSLGGAWR